MSDNDRPSENLVRVENLSRAYGETRAVNAVSFTLRRGQVLGFLGPNGAGKSTTMAMLAGCLAPDSGRILIEGADLREQPCRAKAALGYLPERPPLYRELTVDEYLGYCARLRRLASSTVAAAVAKAKSRCGLNGMGPRLIGQLSKGWQQRVGLAQAIVHEPAVLILDEPTVGLDPLQIREIRDLIRELGGDRGVILSTHILSEVQAVCSHVQILHRGSLVYAGGLADLDQRAAVGQWVVAFSAPPPPSVLAELPAVTEVDELTAGRFRVRAAGDPVPMLVETACARGWGLRELTPERAGLEQMFIAATLDQEDAR